MKPLSRSLFSAMLLLTLLLQSAPPSLLAAPIGGGETAAEQELELMRRQFSSLTPGFPAIGKRDESSSDTSRAAGAAGAAGASPSLDKDCVSRAEFQKLRRIVANLYLRLLEAQVAETRRKRLLKQQQQLAAMRLSN